MLSSIRKWQSAFGLSVVLLGFATDVSSAEAAINPAADGKLTAGEVEIAKKAVSGDLERLQTSLMANITEDLSDDGHAIPTAVMLMDNGKIKKINVADIDKLGDPKLILEAYRSALRAIARHDKIVAASIAYTANIKTESSQELAIVTEYEHRLGVSGQRFIAYEFRPNSSELLIGEPVDGSKPFRWFYTSTKNNKS